MHDDSTARPLPTLTDTGFPISPFRYARVVYDDPTDRPRRALAFSADDGVTFSAGETGGFPGNPGADSQGAFLVTNDVFLVGSLWELPFKG